MDRDSLIFIAGHKGLVGSALLRSLRRKGYNNFLLKDRREVDLTDAKEVSELFYAHKIDYVFLAAAKVGGINANNIYRADFLLENLQIQNNIIEASYSAGVKKLLFLGSSCIYPKAAPQPILESALLTSPLEYTNEPYAIAKIAGLKLCESYNLQYHTNYISAMPTNLYGLNDNFNLATSHVLPALIRKLHLAKLLQDGDIDGIIKDVAPSMERNKHSSDEARALAFLEANHIGKDKISLWGSGKALREFLYSDDLADACVYLMENIDFEDIVAESKFEGNNIANTHINIGYGSDVSIKELAHIVASVVGFRGKIAFDINSIDGTPRKLLDSSKLNALGFTPKIDLKTGIGLVYEDYLDPDTPSRR